MISRFFIDRPIFASVLSLIIFILGAVTAPRLPIAQYPDITPPTVQVACTYPGANARVVADTVAAPIEQQVNGTDNMIYMSSTCTNDGAYNLTVTFAVGSDIQLGLVEVQNRVQLAMPQLPNEVQSQGITIKKKSPSILLAVSFFSPDKSRDTIYLSNYATIYIQDELFRLYGVGDINYLGQREYSIRAWLNPDQLATRNLTASDVANALRKQNVQVAPGNIGQQPVPAGQDFELTLSALGRLTTPEQFGEVILKTVPTTTTGPGVRGPDAPVVRLRDVAKLDLGAQSYDQNGLYDGKPSVALGIYQLPGTNAIQTQQGITAKMEELKKRFPKGIDYEIAYDTTPFIKQSIMEVLKTLRDAIILVAIVVLVFLQNWRAALIPLLAVPVALAGTFFAMGAFGFSLNNLSLFGLVLAIGIIVDDAIVVVENVERWLEHGLPPKEAARKAMDEVTGPVVAVALVLSAVFVPCAFISGISGQFFRQFALTIAVSTIISAFNSLTLSPALAALLLKPHSAPKDPFALFLDTVLGWFFKLFNLSFGFSTRLYTGAVSLLLTGSIVALLLYVGLLYATYWLFQKVPTSFIPQQDKGYLLVNVQLPDASSVQRTQEVLLQLDEIARKTEGVKHTVGVSGQSVVYQANAPNWASMFIILDDFDKRTTWDLSGPMIAQKLRGEFYNKVPDADVAVFGPPPVDGLGTAGGFKFMIEDRGDMGLDALQGQTDTLIDDGKRVPGILVLSTVFRADAPALYVDINRTQVRQQGVAIKDVFETLQVYMGSLYINQFNDFGRSWQVNIQADGTFRTSPDEVGKLKVRNLKGEMVPLRTVCDVRSVGAPVMVQRYNLYPSAPVNGVAFPTLSSGDVVHVFDGLANRDLPPKMSYEWTDLMYQQIIAEQDIWNKLIFPISVFVVFVLLAALYESWSLPMAIMLVVPMCLLCAVVGVAISRTAINIFTQIGFIVLVGLACKNAILIVEFAKQQRDEGAALRQATLEACRLRLRPIMMTSFAFILGVVPLVIAEGAGAEMRQALGVAVFSGMLGVTFFGIFLTPVFYFVIGWLTDR